MLRLADEYPGSTRELCALTHRNPFELLAATILSAQTTDERVNMVTPALFARYPTPADLAAADPVEVETLVQSTGFYRNKTKSLIGMANALVDRFDGEVPRAIEDLVTIPGVGRKTANVVLNVAFGESTMAVDTHIFRLGNRTGIAPGATPRAVEDALVRRIPPDLLRNAHHWLILHGRYVCRARTPECWRCVAAAWCKYPDKTPPPAEKPPRTR